VRVVVVVEWREGRGLFNVRVVVTGNSQKPLDNYHYYLLPFTTTTITTTTTYYPHCLRADPII